MTQPRAVRGRLPHGHVFGTFSWSKIIRQGHSPLWAVPSPRQGVLDCTRKQARQKLGRASWEAAFFRGLCFSSCLRPALSSCPDFSQWWTVTWYVSHCNPFLPELLHGSWYHKFWERGEKKTPHHLLLEVMTWKFQWSWVLKHKVTSQVQDECVKKIFLKFLK